MAEVEGIVRRERLEAAWTGQFRDQAVRVYSESGPLDSGSEVEVKLPAEPLLDKLVIGGNQTQRRVFLGQVIAFAIFLLSGLPLLSLFLGGEILLRRIVRFCIGWKTRFGGGKGWRVQRRSGVRPNSMESGFC